MKKWTIETLNDQVDKEILSLSLKTRAVISNVLSMIEEFGLEFVDKRYLKQVRNKLWEIKANDGRLLYVTVHEKRVIILHAFTKKTMKLPSKNLKLALERLKNIER